MSGSVSSAASTIVHASAAAPVAEAIGEAAVGAVAKGGVSGAGWLGYGAGAAGLVITLLNTWKDSVGSQRGIDTGGLFGNAGMAIGGGALLLTLGESGKLGGVAMRNGLRGAGLALVAGGLIGAVAGAMQRFGGDVRPRELDDSRLQRPKNFTTDLPATPANLEGMAISWGEAITKDRKLLDLGMYVDPATARQLPKGTTLGAAIGEAHARAQEDDQDRSHAVIQTKDGAYWTMRLSGDLDQVDGRNYTSGNQLDPNQHPMIGKQQAALQAISGVESVYVFPAGIGGTEAPQDPGSVPWVTPTLPAAKPSVTATATATATATPTPTSGSN